MILSWIVQRSEVNYWASYIKLLCSLSSLSADNFFLKSTGMVCLMRTSDCKRQICYLSHAYFCWFLARMIILHGQWKLLYIQWKVRDFFLLWWVATLVVLYCVHTVQFKCKLTVPTRNSSFGFRGSRTKFRGSSFETRRIFRGSRTEISRKRFNSRKQNNSDEQNSRCAALFLQTRCWMYANIFSCCAISTRHTWFAYLHWSWWEQSLASKCIYNVSC